MSDKVNEKNHPDQEKNSSSKRNRNIPNRPLHISRGEDPDSLAKNKKKNSAIGKVNPMASLLPNQKEKSTPKEGGKSPNDLSDFFSKVNNRRMNQPSGAPKSFDAPGNNQEETRSSSEETQQTTPKQGSSIPKPSSIIKDSLLKNKSQKSENATGKQDASSPLSSIAKKMAGAMAGFLTAPIIAIVVIVAVIVGALSLIITPVITSTSITVGTYSIDWLISEKWGETISGGIEVDDYDYKNDEISFVNRVIDIANQYRNNGQSFNPHLLSATQFVLSSYDEKFTYDDMSRGVMEELASLMFDQNNMYDEDTFRANLLNSFLPKYATRVNSNLYPNMVDEIFEHVEDYEELFLSGNNQSAYAPGGTCTYVAPGVNINGVQRNVAINASNIQVQLMETGVSSGYDYGGSFGKPMDGEDLIPFEYYAAGCSYQEIGASSLDDAIKTQIIAARSYALSRPFDMGGWRKLENVNGQWILYTAGSTSDQVYCSLEKGCSSNKTTADACQWGMVYSGTNHGRVCQGPLPQGHKLYQIRDEMAGKVLVDKDGYIIYTGFASNIQRQWQSNAATQDYTQLLLSTYASKGAVEVKQMNCTASASDDYHSWKQEDPRWANLPLSPSHSTMAEIGCLVTSLSMMVSKSGVTTNLSGALTPATFLDALIKINSFNQIGELVSYDKVTTIAPELKVYNENVALTGQEQEKVQTIKDYLNQGYYIIAQVYNSDIPQHFVFIDKVDGNKVVMVNPSSTYSYGDTTDLFQAFDSDRIILFKKGV